MGTATHSPPGHGPRKKALSLKRIGWLYPIFGDLHFYHGLLATFRRKIRVALGAGTVTNFAPSKNQQLTGASGREIG